MSVLEQLLDFNSRKEFYFLKDIQDSNQRKDNKCLWRQQRSFSVLEVGWGGQLFHHYVLLWSDGSTLTCFQVQHNRIYKRKAGGKHLCVWFNVKVWMWTGRWAPLLQIDLKVLCPISKRVRKINPARPGEQGGAQAARAIQSLKRRRDFGSLIPVSKSGWEKRVQLDTRWQLITVTCSGHNEWSVPGEVAPQQRSWHDLPPVRVPRGTPRPTRGTAPPRRARSTSACLAKCVQAPGGTDPEPELAQVPPFFQTK